MTLILQATIGFAFLMCIMSAALFVSAGSLAYWQAWVYLAESGGCGGILLVFIEVAVFVTTGDIVLDFKNRSVHAE